MYTQSSRKRNAKINIDLRNRNIYESVKKGQKQSDLAYKYKLSPQAINRIVSEVEASDKEETKFPEIYEAAREKGFSKKCRTHVIRSIVANGLDDTWMFMNDEEISSLRNIGDKGRELVSEAKKIFHGK